MMLRHALLSLGLMLIVSSAVAQRAANRPMNPDERVLSRATLVDQSDRVEIYSDGLSVDADFVKTIDEACAAIEALLGRPYDAATLGKKIKVVASSGVRVSHVWITSDQAKARPLNWIPTRPLGAATTF